MSERHTTTVPTQAQVAQRAPSPFDNLLRLAGRSAAGFALYVLLVTAYVYGLRFVRAFLADLYSHRLVLYTIVALALIIGQGIILEYVTATLAEHLGVVAHEE